MRIFRFFTGKEINLASLAVQIGEGQWAGDVEGCCKYVRRIVCRGANAQLLNFLASGDNKEDHLSAIVREWVAVTEEGKADLPPDRLFERLRDRRIRQLLQSAEVVVQRRLEGVLADWLAHIADSHEARRRLSAAGRRADAFSMAFSKWLARLRSSWQWQELAGLKTLFEKIFLDECSTEIRRSDSRSWQLNQQAVSRSEGVEALLAGLLSSKPDSELLSQSMSILQAYDPFCYALIELVTAGYKYAEIAGMGGMFGDCSADQLRHRADKCRNKLVKYWKSI